MEVKLYIASRNPDYVAGKTINIKREDYDEVISKIPKIVEKMIRDGHIGADTDITTYDNFFIGADKFGVQVYYEDTTTPENDTFYKLVAKNSSQVLLRSIENEKHWNIVRITDGRFQEFSPLNHAVFSS